MGRFSPTVLPETKDFGEELIRTFEAVRQIRREERDEERQVKRDEQDEQDRVTRDELRQLELQERGVRQFDEPPTIQRPVGPRPEITRGRGIGLQPDAGDPGRMGLFEDAQMGVQGRSSPEALSRALGSVPGGGGGGTIGQPIVLAGQLVPGQGFSERAIFPEGPTAMDFQPAAAIPAAREVADPRFTQVNDTRLFLDEEFRGRGEDQEEQAFQQLVASLAAVQGISPQQAEAIGRASQANLPADLISRLVPDEEMDDPKGFTVSELIGLGVDPGLASVVADDAVAARAAIRDAVEPEGRGEQFFKDLIREQGIRRGPGAAAGDPRMEERRDAIVDQLFRGPITELEQDAIDLMAQGMTKEEVLAKIYSLGFPEEEIDELEFYLSAIR